MQSCGGKKLYFFLKCWQCLFGLFPLCTFRKNHLKLWLNFALLGVAIGCFCSGYWREKTTFPSVLKDFVLFLLQFPVSGFHVFKLLNTDTRENQHVQFISHAAATEEKQFAGNRIHDMFYRPELRTDHVPQPLRSRSPAPRQPSLSRTLRHHVGGILKRKFVLLWSASWRKSCEKYKLW